jgi:hypothetical protein
MDNWMDIPSHEHEVTIIYLVFLAPPVGFEATTHGLGTRCSGQVFDQVRHGASDRLATLFPKPSHEHGSLAVSDGEMIGG